MAEIFPNRIRGRAMSIATFALWYTAMAMPFDFSWFVNSTGSSRIRHLRRHLPGGHRLLLGPGAGNERQEPGRDRAALAGLIRSSASAAMSTLAGEETASGT